jgi:hypothetical protein
MGLYNRFSAKKRRESRKTNQNGQSACREKGRQNLPLAREARTGLQPVA